jgi:hypothetical protein
MQVLRRGGTGRLCLKVRRAKSLRERVSGSPCSQFKITEIATIDRRDVLILESRCTWILQ